MWSQMTVVPDCYTLIWLVTLTRKPLNKGNVHQKKKIKLNHTGQFRFIISNDDLSWARYRKQLPHLSFCIYQFETHCVTLHVRKEDTAKSSWSHFLCNHSTQCLAFNVASSKHVQTSLKPQCSGSSYCKEFVQDHSKNPRESYFFPLQVEIKINPWCFK